MFTSPQTSPQIIIQNQGEVLYYHKIFDSQVSEQILQELLGCIDWKNDEVMMFGKQITTKRKVAWYADAGLSYTYAGKRKEPLCWTPLLRSIKEVVQKQTGAVYNSCLLNLYHNGEEGMSWHRDNEKEIVAESSIASLSFGATRKFAFKKVDGSEKVNLLLSNGSLLDMRGAIQHNWYHALLTTKKIQELRVNLTFRLLIG